MQQDKVPMQDLQMASPIAVSHVNYSVFIVPLPAALPCVILCMDAVFLCSKHFIPLLGYATFGSSVSNSASTHSNTQN